jgi:hypothetical protein
MCDPDASRGHRRVRLPETPHSRRRANTSVQAAAAERESTAAPAPSLTAGARSVERGRPRDRSKPFSARPISTFALRPLIISRGSPSLRSRTKRSDRGRGWSSRRSHAALLRPRHLDMTSVHVMRRGAARPGRIVRCYPMAAVGLSRLLASGREFADLGPGGRSRSGRFAVSARGVYHSFDSKQHCLFEVIVRAVSDYRERFDRITAVHAGGAERRASPSSSRAHRPRGVRQRGSCRSSRGIPPVAAGGGCADERQAAHRRTRVRSSPAACSPRATRVCSRARCSALNSVWHWFPRTAT